MRRGFQLGAAAMAMVGLSACFFDQGGWTKSNPGKVTCACDYADACYDGASRTAARGETDQNAEQILYYAQCACFLGSMAGCNTLGHYTKDNIRWCEAGEDVANSCAATGYFFHHGVQLPQGAGPSHDRDEAQARAAFDKACKAGSKVACAEIAN
jgi:TPR repeat protein